LFFLIKNVLGINDNLMKLESMSKTMKPLNQSKGRLQIEIVMEIGNPWRMPINIKFVLTSKYRLGFLFYFLPDKKMSMYCDYFY